MNNYGKLCMGIAVALSVASIPVYADEAAEKPALGVGASITSVSTVEALDLKTRQVTLRNQDGSVSVVEASDKVRNLDQVKVGDHVITEYKVGLVVALTPAAGELRQRVETLEKGSAEPGQKPAGVMRKTVSATGTVTALDTDKRTVTIQGAKQTLTLPVSEDIDLASVKVGDQVNALYQESIAISVKPAPVPAAGTPGQY